MLDHRDPSQIEDFLIRKIESMISKLEQSGSLANKPPELALPLVRLKIENTNFPVIKSKRINDHFMNRVANPIDFLQFYKKAGFMASLNANKTLIAKIKPTTASMLLGAAEDYHA